MKTPPLHNDARLLRYLGATGLLGGLPALGQIQYTDVQPDSVAVRNGGELFFDLNQDGTDDFKVEVLSMATYGVVIDAAVVSAVNLYGNNGVASEFVTTYTTSMGYSSGTYAASKLNAGVLVQAGMDFEGEIPMGAKIGPSGFGFPWEGGVADGFLGLRLEVNGNVHFGWARLDLSSDVDSAVLKDFALNLAPNSPITTGQTVSLVEDLERNLKLQRQGRTVVLEAMADLIGQRFEVLELSGKVIADGVLDNGPQQFELPNDGLFLVRISTLALIWSKKI